MSAIVSYLLTHLPLAEHGVASDHATFQRDRLQQFQRALRLIGFRIHLLLAQDKTCAMIEQREQVDGAFVRLQGANPFKLARLVDCPLQNEAGLVLCSLFRGCVDG